MSDAIAERIEGFVHRPTQVHDDGGVDLTAAGVYQLEAPGRVDFGGDEYHAADLEPHPRTWRNPGDDYGWWHLDAGQYLLGFNEELTGDTPLVLQARPELRSMGAYHTTLHVTSLDPVPLSVGDAGVRLKENARVSTLLSV